jgi:hypothetical protein
MIFTLIGAGALDLVTNGDFEFDTFEIFENKGGSSSDS